MAEIQQAEKSLEKDFNLRRIALHIKKNSKRSQKNEIQLKESTKAMNDMLNLLKGKIDFKNMASSIKDQLFHQVNTKLVTQTIS